MKIDLEPVVFLFMIQRAQQSLKTAATSGIQIIQMHIPIRVHYSFKLLNVVKVCKMFFLLYF